MKALARFWKQHVAELHNMTWPTQNKAIHSTFVVLAIMLVVGIFLGVVDFGLKKGLFFLVETF